MTKFRVISFNAEGLSATKAELLANLNADILCLQETHKDSILPRIPDMHLIISHLSPIHGSVIYARNKAIIQNSRDLSARGLEILQVDTEHINIISAYKPPPTPFVWPQINQPDGKAVLILGDFNSHNTIWSYDQNDHNGEAVEEWALAGDLTLLHDAKDDVSFQSARWRRGYNPDLAFVSSKHHQSFLKTMSKPIPKSQHRPITIDIKPVIRPRETNCKNLRFNYRKAKWVDFSPDLDSEISTISPDPQQYENFQSLVWKAAKKNIPRGCRRTYIPGLNDQCKELYQEYVEAYNEDPLANNTIELGETLLNSISNERRARWQETATNINLTHNSKKGWATIK